MYKIDDGLRQAQEITREGEYHFAADSVAMARTLLESRAEAIDRLEAKLDAVRNALGNHPTCDTYEDGEACGWKRAVADITKAIGENNE